MRDGDSPGRPWPRCCGRRSSTTGLHRVVAQMDARNTASARLATAVGMRHEAHMRQDWWNKGEWTDTLVFGRPAEDRNAP